MDKMMPALAFPFRATDTTGQSVVADQPGDDSRAWPTYLQGERISYNFIS